MIHHVSEKGNLTLPPQALDRGGALKAAAKIATGHNADDIAETVLLNIVRGDLPRRVGRTHCSHACRAARNIPRRCCAEPVCCMSGLVSTSSDGILCSVETGHHVRLTGHDTMGRWIIQVCERDVDKRR